MTAFTISLSAAPGASVLWVTEAKLTALDPTDIDHFGYRVAMSGDTAVISALTDDVGNEAGAGSAYILVRSGGVWAQQAKLTASDAAMFDGFGTWVAISGDTVVIGATGDDHAGGLQAGAAYVFVRSGTTWSQQQKLVAPDANSNDAFGAGVAVSGDTLVVGATFGDHPSVPDAGAAYVFVRSGTVWSLQAKLTAPDAAAVDVFGSAVTLEGNTAVIGAYSSDPAGVSAAGAAYVFVRSGTVWGHQAKLTASDGAAFDNFGQAVAISGNTALIGATFGDQASVPDSGAAYVFTRSGTVWNEQAKLTASDAGAYDLFGFAVSISGDRAVVGAFANNADGGEDSGAAYAYSRAGTVWTQQPKLMADDGATYDSFGVSVAVTGDTILAGSYASDYGGHIDPGATYAYRLVTCCAGDVDGSGLVTFGDVPAFVQVLMSGAGTPGELCAADVNADGARNGDDVQPFLDKIASGGACP